MSANDRVIVFNISGWTYMIDFPYSRHDSEHIVCSGRTRLGADDDDEVEKRNLYLEINRRKSATEESAYFIAEDGVNVTIFVERDDFYRIFQELKDHFKIPECQMNIEISGSLDANVVHKFVDFQLNLAVDRLRNS